MWQRLSGLDRFQFACCVIVIWAAFVGVLIFAMQERWLATALIAVWMLHPALVLHRVIKRGSGKPQFRAVPSEAAEYPLGVAGF
jgi:hypothetical protein